MFIRSLRLGLCQHAWQGARRRFPACLGVGLEYSPISVSTTLPQVSCLLFLMMFCGALGDFLSVSLMVDDINIDLRPTNNYYAETSNKRYLNIISECEFVNTILEYHMVW